MDKSDEHYHRWRTSLHEGAHAVVGTVLARRCHASTEQFFALLTPSGGVSHCGYDGMTSVHNADGAIYAAAGEHGERLANRYRPPRLRTAPAAITTTTPPVGMKRKTFTAVCKSQKQVPRDSDYVRAFCTQTPDGNLWSKRFREVHKQAWQIVKDHRREVCAIARLLYTSGVILSGEINAIMPPLQEDDCI